MGREQVDPTETTEIQPLPADYFLGGKAHLVDQHDVALINDLTTQRERAEEAVLYVLHTCGLYEEPRSQENEVKSLDKAYKNLPSEGSDVDVEEVMQEAARLRARKLGLEVLLQTNRAVKRTVRKASDFYHENYFETTEDIKDPILNGEAVMDLFDKTDDLAEKAPSIVTLHTMNGLDRASQMEAERLLRIIIANDRELTSQD